MNERDRLREIIETLPRQQVQALLTLLAPNQSTSHDEFTRLLADAPGEGVDEETAARVLASEAEPGESISHDEMKRRLGVAAESFL